MNIYLVVTKDDRKALDEVKIEAFANYRDAKYYYNREVEKILNDSEIIKRLIKASTTILKNDDIFNIFDVDYCDITIEIIKKEVKEGIE